MLYKFCEHLHVSLSVLNNNLFKTVILVRIYDCLAFTDLDVMELSIHQGSYIWVSKDAPQELIQKIFGVQHFGAIPEIMVRL